MRDRAELGVDGNCGFALLGDNLQEGEAEFVEIEHSGSTKSDEYAVAAGRAASKAFTRLKARLGRPLSYYIGPSHPRHVP